MEIIDRAIKNGKHISGNKALDGQTWADFETIASEKKLILFGAGAGSGGYFERYGDRGNLAGVVDNDSGKQGFWIEEFIPEAFGLKSGKTRISAISLFDVYDPEEVVVLVTSTNHYGTIIGQLGQLGMKHCFVLVIMEANEQEASDKRTGIEESGEEKKIQFAGMCCRQEKINRKRIFFKAYGDYTDHGKYITEALLKAGKDLDLVWAVNDMRAEVPDGVRKIYAGNWKRFIYEMETSAMWILDLPVPSYIIKRPGQIYIQTKHWASITLKRFYLDASTFQGVPEKINVWKREQKLIDHIITGSDFDTESCRRGFGFEGEVLQYGSPRSDGLFREAENRDKVFGYYHLDKDRRALIYAPTYRFSKTKGKTAAESRNIGLDFERVKGALEARFGGEWYILVRLHPSVASALQEMEKPDFVIDVSLYGDSQELVSASDILISDFSSIMFEASFVKKPVFLFATDLEDYLLNEYDLLIGYHDLPFPTAESNVELEQNILGFCAEEYEEKVTTFLERYGVHEDGHAGERAAQFIVDTVFSV